MNECTSCGLDFASVKAFDRHRTGVHEYLFAEGLRMEPPREDGRRCLDEAELLDAGLELDGHGRWRVALTATQLEWFAGKERQRLHAAHAVNANATGASGVPGGVLTSTTTKRS